FCVFRAICGEILRRTPSGPVADWPYSDFVVVFPAGAGRGAGEEGGGFGVVGEAFCHGVEVEAAADALGDDAEQENLGERPGDVEGPLRLLAALAGEDEVFDVVRETGRRPRQLRRELTHLFLRDDADRAAVRGTLAGEV